jgi:hypothetical protein
MEVLGTILRSRMPAFPAIVTKWACATLFSTAGRNNQRRQIYYNTKFEYLLKDTRFPVIETDTGLEIKHFSIGKEH